MRLIDEQYLRTPFYGSRRMPEYLNDLDHGINRKRIQRLMRNMRLEGLAPGPNTSRKHSEHKIYPYLLRNLKVTYPDPVWSVDMTYIPMRLGFACTWWQFSTGTAAMGSLCDPNPLPADW
ncbi:MAG: IS3 family transposase [Methylococcales bacterium]